MHVGSLQTDLGSLQADTLLRGLSEWSVCDSTVLMPPANVDGAFIVNAQTGTKQLHLGTCLEEVLRAIMSPVSYEHLVMMGTGVCVCVCV